MLNRSANLAMSTSTLKALPGKLDIKRHSPSIPYFPASRDFRCLLITSLVQVCQIVLTQIRPEVILQTVWTQIRPEVILQTVWTQIRPEVVLQTV